MMQAKLVMGAQNGKLRDWTRGALLHCLDLLGVKVAGSSHRRGTLLCCMLCLFWHSGMPLCQTRTVLRVLQHRQAAPNPAARNRWMTWMDSSMNERVVPTYLHVPICCFVLCCLLGFFPFSCLTVFPHVPLLVFNAAYICFMWWIFSFPFFPGSTFSSVSPFGFQCLFFCGTFPAHTLYPFYPFSFSKSFFLYCYVSACPRWFPIDQQFINCVKASIFPLFLLPHFPHIRLLVFKIFLPLFVLTHFPHSPILVFKGFFIFVLLCF